MFTIPTTIVLGAGASCGYGYPLGHRLIDQIIAQSVANDGTNDSVYPIGPSQRLRVQLGFYDPTSIDAFLAHYGDDEELINYAKKIITQILLLKADKSKFERKDGSEHWYRYLWEAIVSGRTAKQLVEEPLNLDIVTFNYDVSLEYFLYSRVTSQDSEKKGS